MNPEKSHRRNCLLLPSGDGKAAADVVGAISEAFPAEHFTWEASAGWSLSGSDSKLNEVR